MVPVEKEQDIRLGLGYNTFIDESRAPAVRADSIFSEAGSGQEKSFELRMIRSQRDLRRAMEIGASASYSWGFGKVSAKTRFSTEHELRSTSVHLLVKTVVRNEKRSLAKFALEPRAAALIDATPVDWRAFLARYGDSFIGSIITGGEFYALYELHTQSMRDKRALEAQLSVVVGGFEGGTSMKHAVEQLSVDTEVTVRIYVRGGRGKLPDPLESANILDAAVCFPEAVDPERGAPLPFAAVVRDYPVIDGFPIDAPFEPSRLAFGRLIDLSDRVQARLAAVVEDPARRREDALQRIRTEIEREARSIADDPIAAHAVPTALEEQVATIEHELVWRRVPGQLTQIAVGDATHVWGIDAGGRISRWDAALEAWQAIPGGARHISVGADGATWLIGGNGAPYRWTSQTWEKKPGGLKQIAVGDARQVWAINAAGTLFRWAENRWNEVARGGFSDVSAGADGMILAVRSGQLVRCVGEADLEPFPGQLVQVAVGSRDQIAGIDPDGHLVRWDGETWETLPGYFTQADIGADGSLWAVTGQGELFRLSGSP